MFPWAWEFIMQQSLPYGPKNMQGWTAHMSTASYRFCGHRTSQNDLPNQILLLRPPITGVATNQAFWAPAQSLCPFWSPGAIADD
jgi:hypothetical protein